MRLLLVGGEIITDQTRRICREQLGIEPTEFYGAVEMGVMAFETPARDGLHLCEDQTLFEFLGAEATSLFMQLYTYRFGTTEEKAELEAMTKMGAREAKVERFRNRLIKKWQDKLPRWLS